MSVVAGKLTEMFARRSQPIILAALREAVGQPPGFLVDEARFRETVIDPAWNQLPIPLRLMGRERLRWDEILLGLRPEVFDIASGKIRLRADAEARVNAALGLEEEPADVIPLPDPSKPSSGPPPLPKPPRPAKSGSVKPSATPPRPPQPKAAAKKAPDPTTTAVGIDLGTTYSVIAYLDAHGRPTSIPNAAGDILSPSVVLFDPEGPVVGKEAVAAAALEPDRVAVCVKRDMGQKAYRHKINGESMPPEVISSLILRSLKADAARRLGPVRKAVITVPAYFDEVRRRATMDAGRLAGLEVLDIINEPTAAAIAYGYQVGFLDPTGKAPGDRPLRVLVYDLGGGTFDVTILEIRGTSFKALATDGDVYLGGKDWDERLINIAAERFIEHAGEDPRDNPVTTADLWNAAEAAKRTLSERPRASLIVNHLGNRLKVDITRQEFEEATADLLGRTRTTLEIVVRQAGLSWPAIDRVLLVGGSTRMPMVVRLLEELTGKPPEQSLSPDEAVAHGAALYADLLLRQQGIKEEKPAFSVTNINSHSLGIIVVETATGRRRNRILIPKNTPLPFTVTKVFPTHKPNQRSVAIRVVEGESERPEACIQVGLCSIRDLPPHLPAGWPVQVSYSYKANGRLNVNARVKGQATSVRVDFIRDNVLSKEELASWALYVRDEKGAGDRE